MGKVLGNKQRTHIIEKDDVNHEHERHVLKTSWGSLPLPDPPQKRDAHHGVMSIHDPLKNIPINSKNIDVANRKQEGRPGFVKGWGLPCLFVDWIWALGTSKLFRLWYLGLNLNFHTVNRGKSKLKTVSLKWMRRQYRHSWYLSVASRGCSMAGSFLVEAVHLLNKLIFSNWL